MRKIFLFVILMVAFSAISVSAQNKIRVNFAKNQYEKTLTGNVSGSGYVDYVLRVTKYYSIEVSLTSTNKKLKIAVRNPQGNLIDDDSEGKNFIGFAEKTGDYTIRVYGSGKGSSKFKIRIAAFQGT